VGEDLQAMLEGLVDLVVDAPGFLGDFEEGYQAALQALEGKVDGDCKGINIDGLDPIDPYYRGNIQEAQRLFALGGLTPATRFCADRYEAIYRAAPYSITTNPDLASAVGKSMGDLLGLEGTGKALADLQNHHVEMNIDPVLTELERVEERVVRVCEKFLRRNDPPSVLIFGGASYSLFAAEILDRYLDAEIIAIGSRNRTPQTSYRLSRMRTFREISACIQQETPDLVLGSSYDSSLCGEAAFVPFTFPLRGRIHLRSRTLVGIEGTLSLVEDVLNACLDRKKRNKTSA
jgi:nitrogenase molybdenum-iron protein alpha/beta subunit